MLKRRLNLIQDAEDEINVDGVGRGGIIKKLSQHLDVKVMHHTSP